MGYYICTSCHAIGKPARKKRGSGKIEFFLWMIFPLNVPYTLWRMLTKYNVCSSCGSQMLIPEDSIVGQRLLTSMERGTAPILQRAKRLERDAIPFQVNSASLLPRAEEQLSSSVSASPADSVLDEERLFFAERAVMRPNNNIEVTKVLSSNAQVGAAKSDPDSF